MVRQFVQAKRVALSHALCALWAGTAGAALGQSASPSQAAPVLVRFIDSATGYAVRPEVQARPHRAGAAEQRFEPALVSPAGHAALALERGRHTVTAVSPAHQPVAGELEVRENFPYQVRFLLDPVELPRELRAADIAARRRAGATLIQGFVVDEDSSEPLGGVAVSSQPGGETVTDGRGFFQLHVPVPDPASGAPASLVFQKPGYQAQEWQYLELWSGGDWTYAIRLNRGGGCRLVDERTQRRQETRMESGALTADRDSPLNPPSPASAFSLAAGPVDPPAATVRIPRNIRAEKDGVIYYTTMDFYTKHVLPHEWIASWNMTSLYAGSVAVRCYAIARINGRAPGSDYDICGTSACQVFKPTSSSTRTDTAVEFTEGCVLLNANGNIPSTEYSAENNSLGKDCGDGFTAPSGGCLYDPICAGHDRAGHGRGMCQRGSQRWGNGANGFPARDWLWILRHYYPVLTLVKGAVLVVGDNVRSRSGDCDVRACAGGGIGSGVACPLLTTKAAGQTGVIIGGPLVVTNDGKGFTWYQVRWNDAGSTTGWSCENYLERLFSMPTAPASLTATAVATNRIALNWTDTSGVEAGFSIERAPAAAGPWLELGTVKANVTTFADASLHPGSTWYYRVRAFNAAGDSAYTGVAGATTPAGVAPTLSPLHDLAVTPGTLLTVTNSASAPERVALITDFEPFLSETANGVVLFRTPNCSGTTSGFLDSAPEMDLAAVTDTRPAAGPGPGMALYVRCHFTNAANPWLRLTTSNTVALANPVIDFSKKLRFDIYADQPVRVAVGCRETTTPIGAAIGSDGGTTGSSLEWAGVTNVAGTAPVPTRTVASNTWTTLTFDFSSEPIRSFSGGNGVLSTASGLGVLEHLAIVPAAGIGIYNLYLDNFAVLVPRTFTYSLGAGAPTNAGLNAVTGVFTWTPTPAQSPSTNQVSVIVTDNSSPPLRATNTFTIVVKDSVPNSPPLLAPIGNQTVYAGSTLLFTNSAYDPNPADTLTFSLDPGAPPAAYLNPATGVFSWTPAAADTNSVHPITIRVTDSGSPRMSATAGFSVTVLPPPPPNQAPMLLPIANRSVNAGSLLLFTNQAFDPDGNNLIHSLGAGAPGGATIGPVSGVFSWTPPDADSNTTRSITVRVTDDGLPPLSASASFNVTVLPRLPNHAPGLSAIADRVVHAGSAIVFTNTATDPDGADTLSFSLEEDAPAGAEVDTVTGVFSWTPTDAQGNTTNAITVWVTDDGEPPLSASATCAITVRPRPLIETISISGTTATLEWSAIPNTKYRLQCKTNLLEGLWQTLGPDLTATNTAAAAIDAGFGAAPQRFYRVRVAN